MAYNSHEKGAVTLQHSGGNGKVTLSEGGGKLQVAVVADGANAKLFIDELPARGFVKVGLQGWVNQGHVQASVAEQVTLVNCRGEQQVWVHSEARKSLDPYVLVDNGARACKTGQHYGQLIQVQMEGWVNVDHIQRKMAASPLAVASLLLVNLRHRHGKGKVTVGQGRDKPPVAVVADGAFATLPDGKLLEKGFVSVQLQGWANQGHIQAHGGDSVVLVNRKSEVQVWVHAEAKKSRDPFVLVDNGAVAHRTGQQSGEYVEVYIVGLVNVEHVVVAHSYVAPLVAVAAVRAQCSALQWNLWGFPQPEDMQVEEAVRDKNRRQMAAVLGAIQQHEPTVLNFCEYLNRHSETEWPFLREHFIALTDGIKAAGYHVVHEGGAKRPFMAVKERVPIISSGRHVEGAGRSAWISINLSSHQVVFTGVHLASGGGQNEKKRDQLNAALKHAVATAGENGCAVVAGDCNWFSSSKMPPGGCGQWESVGGGNWADVFEEVHPDGAVGTQVEKKGGVQRGFIDKTLFTKKTLQLAHAVQLGDPPEELEAGKRYPDNRFRHPSDHLGTFVEFEFKT